MLWFIFDVPSAVQGVHSLGILRKSNFLQLTPTSKQLQKILISIRDQSSWIAPYTSHDMQVEGSFERKFWYCSY